MDMKRLETLYNCYLMRTLSEVICGRGVDVKGQIFNFVRFRRLRCQIVCLSPTIRSCMVTLTSDHFFRIKGHQKGQIFNFVGFQWLRCQIVGLRLTIKSVHVDSIVQPPSLYLGSKVNNTVNIFCCISTVRLSNCWVTSCSSL